MHNLRLRNLRVSKKIIDTYEIFLGDGVDVRNPGEGPSTSHIDYSIPNRRYLTKNYTIDNELLAIHQWAMKKHPRK